MIEYIKNNENLLAIIVKNDYKQKGLKFFTSETNTQQIGCVGHPKGTVCQAHIHNKIKREVYERGNNRMFRFRNGKVKRYEAINRFSGVLCFDSVMVR